jgi:hypothetical protein
MQLRLIWWSLSENERLIRLANEMCDKGNIALSGTVRYITSAKSSHIRRRMVQALSFPSVLETLRSPNHALSKHSRNNDHRQHHRQDQQQAARLSSRALLVPTRSSQLLVCISCVVSCLSDVVADNVQTLTLLVDHVRHISEQLVQFTD